MKTQIFPGTYSPLDFYQLVIGSIGPRPIALISTISMDGINNLAPYSFFNMFSVNPPILAFSTSLKPAGTRQKDTFRNINETRECVINVVSQDIMHQMSITSADYPYDVDEFAKADFHLQDSKLVAPPSVLESKANLECKVNQIIELGNPLAGYLVICDVVRIVLNDEVISDGNRIDPDKMDLVGRLGRNFYSKTDGSSRVEIPRPSARLPIGFDLLPDFLRHNQVLTGKELYYFAIQDQLLAGDRPSEIDFSIDESLFIDQYVRKLLSSDINMAFTLLTHYYKKTI